MTLSIKTREISSASMYCNRQNCRKKCQKLCSNQDSTQTVVTEEAICSEASKAEQAAPQPVCMEEIFPGESQSC